MVKPCNNHKCCEEKSKSNSFTKILPTSSQVLISTSQMMFIVMRSHPPKAKIEIPTIDIREMFKTTMKKNEEFILDKTIT